MTGAPARQPLRQLLLRCSNFQRPCRSPALLYLPTSLSVARTRACFCCGRWAGTHKCRERRMRRSDKSHQSHLPLALRPKPGCPHLGTCLRGTCLRRCSEGTPMMPAGARARSLSRPSGLYFVYAPRSACFKGPKQNKSAC